MPEFFQIWWKIKFTNFRSSENTKKLKLKEVYKGYFRVRQDEINEENIRITKIPREQNGAEVLKEKKTIILYPENI